MNELKRINKRSFFLIIALLISGCGFNRPEEVEETETEPILIKEEYPDIETKIFSIDDQGSIILDLSVQQFNEKGYETGDEILVEINEKSFEMPIGLKIDEVSTEQMICLFENESGSRDIVKLALNNGSFFETISDEIKVTGNDAESFPVIINMKEKQGHSEGYPADEREYLRTSLREDYPYLTDEEYANFRQVEAGDIKEGILYRSSSPLNFKLNRYMEADEAVRKAGITTVFNMADFPDGLKFYDYYEDSYYKDCSIIALNMSTIYHTDEFKERLVQGYRYMIENEGPYLIHCTEGKDRTGFAVAILECLMSAKVDEVISDYMKTFYNYYGVKLGTSVYNKITQRNIKKDLITAFQIDSLYDADLSVCAQDYLLTIGMSEEEVAQLKKILSE